MITTLNADNTVTLTVNQNELASVNDALNERIHLSVMADGKPVRGYLGRADEEMARQLECATYGEQDRDAPKYVAHQFRQKKGNFDESTE
jgi:hypothetical protein